VPFPDDRKVIDVRRRRTLPAVAAAVVLLAAGCSSGEFRGGDLGQSRATSAPSPGSSAGAPAPASCPASYVEPDRKRPEIRLSFDLADDLATVTGTENVTFTPDLPIREVVFRLTPNSPSSVDQGNSIRITSASVDPAGQKFGFEPAGAPASTQGGLLVIPLEREVPAGQQVTATVAFQLTLGRGAFDRFGRVDSYAWWGTGQPLLAWEDGVGWHKEPLLRFVGESATSEAARIDLTVTAPERLTVLMSGTPENPASADGGRRRWHSVADRARDVSVAAGTFTVKQTTVDGARLVVGTREGEDPSGLLGEHARAMRELARRYGPFPFSALSVARLPIGGGGIEYPGSILMLDDSREVVVHETAHQWFYAMVGDSQARDPWLDEAFATFAEQLVDGQTGQDVLLNMPGEVGGSMTDFGTNEGEYYTVVYGKGAAALQAARDAAGAEKFDAALRCYINANAWQIARPADLVRALSSLPQAIAVLKRAGALP
jgi:Peptidase family M1 domain